MSRLREGGCQCGSVRYGVTGEPKTVVVCHCSECQRQTGSAFGMYVLFAKNQFTLKSGTLKTFSRVADSGRPMHSHFCPDCGTQIYQEKEPSSTIVIVTAGSLDDASSWRPSSQLWTRSKHPWLELPADIRSFEVQPA